ncbi:alpha/beta fold hydrolase [Isachenkonia alkalipeptolytica]|uniref:Alpha/beta hydrolase n=1 Tax=Isachenkonia alkalipeptolytica TaxID=2565777 RepID=A0AA43XMR4_9CLOT|nr:alpha/beta hydrolase [Isachenkonia alkalipeptolytica]NBG89407.1 alpha/beta hydrolase [Isachenkonia alkalipeptolytica]
MAVNRLESKYLTLEEGIEMHYVEKGEGDPMVLIPGLTFSWEIFNAQIHYFSKNYRVIAIDPRSQGLSTKTVHGNDYLTHGKDLAKLIEALELENILLVGWSTGNLDAWGYLKQYGTAKVQAVVTIDMSPRPLSPNADDWTEASIEELRTVVSEIFISPEGTRDFFSDYTKEVMLQQPPDPEELEFILDLSAKTPYYVCSALFTNAVFSDFTDTVKKVSENVPSLMFIAEHWADVAEPYMKKISPKTQNIVMGGHLMFYESPEKWNKALEKFLKEGK